MSATSADLQAIERLIGAMPPEKLAALAELPAVKARLAKKWLPNAGPQQRAYYCEADELLYGGEAGGGKLSRLMQRFSHRLGGRR